jgi:hypothetical protein
MNSSELLALLTSHRGASNGIKCATLAAQAALPERQVRKLISDLRFEGAAIVGTPDTGYYIAESAEELKHFTEFYWHRIRHSLAIVSRVTHQSMPSLLGQLSLLESNT